MALHRYEQYLASIDGSYNYKSKLLLQLNKIQQANNVEGNIAEIGVHHGKSFIPLACLITGREKALAIDYFSLQQHDIYNPGTNNYHQFQSYCLYIFGIVFFQSNIVVYKGNSLTLSSQDLLTLLHNKLKFRIFAIDNSQSKEATLYNLTIASHSMHILGVLIVYIHNSDTKDGVTQFLKQNPAWTEFYIASDKILLCRVEQFLHYTAANLA